MKTILSTKKLSLHQKEKIKKAGYLLVEKKFIKTKKVVFSITITNEFLIFTSKKAVKSILHIKKQLVTNKVFCVGEKTKKYLEKKGFHVVEYKDYAEELAQVIVSKYTTTSFVFFCGNIRRDTLPKKLTENKIELKEVVVYQTTLKPHIINNTFDAIMFFSPSGIKSYIIKNKIQNEQCICIGNTTAKEAEKHSKNIHIATKPTIESTIKKTIKICSQLM